MQLTQKDSVTFPRMQVNMILQTAFFKNRTTGEVHKLQVQFVNKYHMALADLKASTLVCVIVKETQNHL